MVGVILSSVVLSAACFALADLPKPFSVPVSEYWDGDDGHWSTFSFQLGTPPQQVRLLPSTSGNSIAPILRAACSRNETDSADCSEDRGGLFEPSASTSWSPIGTYEYAAAYNQPRLLGDWINASYGFDSAQLSWPGSSSPQLSGQVVAGLMDDVFGWFQLGQFGLSPRAVNFTSLSNSHEAPIAWLRNRGLIPSTTWAYTAGSYNEAPPAFGSLTLGGYDTTRVRPNNITFPFGTDISRDLLVGLQRITSDKTTSALMPTAAYAYIDSEIPTIVLPVDACEAFERAFNLTYYTQKGQGYYLLDEEQYQSLHSLSPTITFTLGPSLAGGATVDVHLPFSTFDMQLSPPLGVNGTRYFPIQRGDNSSQFVLGRTFLQQAYVIADYDRSSFQVAQALFPQNTQPQIQPILPPGVEDKKHLSPGRIAGIVIGAVAAAAIVVGILISVCLRNKRRRQQAKREDVAEILHEDARHAADRDAACVDYGGFQSKAELSHESARVAEAHAAGMPHELSNSPRETRYEMDGKGDDKTLGPVQMVDERSGRLIRPIELNGDARVEVDAAQTLSELDGRNVAHVKKAPGVWAQLE